VRSDNIAKYPQDDANGAQKTDAIDCRYCRKHLNQRHFRYSHIVRANYDRCRGEGSMPAEDALRGL